METGLAEPGAMMTKLEEVKQRIGHHFVRSEPRIISARYLEALLKPVSRKNCWQLAEAASEHNPYGMQRLLCHARWNPDTVRDDLRDYVMEYLGDPEGIGVIDETGFIKEGDKSVGVQRQYSGTAGKIENCQVGVFLAYASAKGKAFLDRELYLPKEWADNPPRRKEAGIPERVKFVTKPQLARRMIKRAREAGVRFRWIIGDEVYGNRELRHWLEEEKQPYVLAVRANQYVWKDFRQWQVKRLAREIVDSWERINIGDGAKGPRVYDWARIKLPDSGLDPNDGWGRWLLMRRSVEKPDEIAYYLTAGLEDESLESLAVIAGKRWAIEMAFEEAKGEAGLDEYEVRKWGSWYRHVTLSLFAHAYLAVCHAYGDKRGAMQS